ncbi:MAG: SRPBCC family protein [Thermomicrobiales bacterium]
MVTVTRSVKISRPAGDVYAFVSNYENDLIWRENVVEMEQTPRNVSDVGTTTREVLKSFGMNVETTAEVTGCEPGRRIDFRSTSGPVPVTGFRQVEADDSGATFTYHLEMEPAGVYRLLAPMMSRSFNEQVDKDLDKLKVVLEGE